MWLICFEYEYECAAVYSSSSERFTPRKDMRLRASCRAQASALIKGGECEMEKSGRL
jgi:hypothetical protein